MTNKEAIKILTTYIKSNCIGAGYTGSALPDSINLAIKALEVKDRLEQAGKLGVVCRPHKYGSKIEAFAEGYKQALADIRGDNNG